MAEHHRLDPLTEDDMVITPPARETWTWMPLLDGLPIAAVPDRQWNARTDREDTWLRAIVVTGEGSRVQHTAVDLACWWAGWRDDVGRVRWDAALVSVAHPDLDHELLVLDCDEADAWVSCLQALDRISGGSWAAEDLSKKKRKTQPE